MSKKEKLIKKLKSNAKSFTYDDAETLLGMLGYRKNNKGKTSGSRVKFTNFEKDSDIILHKPHPQKELKEYQIKQMKDGLKKEGLI